MEKTRQSRLIRKLPVAIKPLGNGVSVLSHILPKGDCAVSESNPIRSRMEIKDLRRCLRIPSRATMEGGSRCTRRAESSNGISCPAD